MSSKAWDMLRENYKADAKGRHKTADAMKVAVHFEKENDQLRAELENLARRHATLQQALDRLRHQPIQIVGSDSQGG